MILTAVMDSQSADGQLHFELQAKNHAGKPKHGLDFFGLKNHDLYFTSNEGISSQADGTGLVT